MSAPRATLVKTASFHGLVVPDFRGAAVVDSKQEAADDSRFERGHDNDVASWRKRSTDKNTATVAKRRRCHHRHDHVHTKLAVVFHLTGNST